MVTRLKSIKTLIASRRIAINDSFIHSITYYFAKQNQFRNRDCPNYLVYEYGIRNDKKLKDYTND